MRVLPFVMEVQTMKQYQVTRAFIDKETGEPYNAGSSFQTDNEARAKTLKEAGFIAGGIVSKSDTGKGKGADKPDGGGEKPEETKTPAAGEEKPDGKGGK